MKRFPSLLVAVLLLLHTGLSARVIGEQDAVILFDNDVHGHMDGYAKFADLRKATLRQTPNVCVVSLGDFAQGGPLCSVSHGQYAVDIMNEVGYDYIALGNHEFDYGIEQLHQLTGSLHAKTLTFNFVDIATQRPVFAPYAIRQMGSHKVAFIGCVTPITRHSDAPDSFVGPDGKDMYTFCHGTFCTLLQQYVNEVRAIGADKVVLLAHLGDVDNAFETSEEVIHSTYGIDVVLDGHAHHVIESRRLCNAKGDSVLMSSSGAHFQYMGRLVIDAEGNCSSDLIDVSKYQGSDQDIPVKLAAMQKAFDNLPVIAKTPYDLAAFDYQHDTYDRNCQTNLGSLCADAFRVMSRADIGWVNAGGIRASIPAGNITFKELLNAFPFENKICVCQFTGQQIMDALEYGISRAPEDNASYPQVSGISYDVDMNVKPNILTDATGGFIAIGEGPRRVHNIRVLNPLTNLYEPINLAHPYKLASIDFILLKGGCNGMLSKGMLIADDQMVDTQLIENYIRTQLNGVIDEAYKDYKQ
ncbi:MAG: bifunctional metallophosphatase/5'-nucleotidase [Bacteroidales bacterium]|nr:bifunctional metallophosphatase/5'-nucleotidase [Bacteroidales bacterium]